MASISTWLKILATIEKHNPNVGNPIAGAGHDVIWLNLNACQLDPESEDGKAFAKLGPYYDDENEWSLYA